jgi:hypothetical protein
MESEPGSSKGKPLPGELMGRAPHRVRLTGTGWLYAFASAFFIFLAVYFAVKLVQLVNKEKANQISLRQSGVQTMGRITGESRGHLSYTFEVDGTIYSGRAELPVDIRDNLHGDDLLPVRYLPATPDVNHPAAWEESPNSDWWGLIFPGFLVFMGLLSSGGFRCNTASQSTGCPHGLALPNTSGWGHQKANAGKATPSGMQRTRCSLADVHAM